MRLAIAALMLTSLSLIAPTKAAQKLESGPLVSKAVEGFIRPLYAQFHDASSGMRTAMDTLCATPSQAALDSARDVFASTARDWSKIEIIRFGPVGEHSRLERILFWPDRKGTGLKQVQAALAGEDPSVTDAAQLAGKSVAMQGLGALEFILHGTDSDTLSNSAAFRCAYGKAVATNIETMAGEIEAEWARPDGFASQWQSPGAGNPLYRDSDEALGELFDVFVNGLELVRDVRLRGFLGSQPEADKPKQALYWRSGRTGASLSANLTGLKALFETSGLGDSLPDDAAWIAQSIDVTFANGVAAADAVEGPVAEVLADPARRAKLDLFATVTSSLSNLFGVRLAGELGLSAGFSSLDGD